MDQMGQTNVDAPGSGTTGDGFGAGMIVAIVLLILIVLVLVFYAGPQIFINISPRSLFEQVASASALA